MGLATEKKTSEKLLDAAEYRMRRGGYNAVSFRDLAQDLGIKSASVHHHFARKETLTIALVERYTGRFFEYLNAKANRAKSPAAKLRAFNTAYKLALTEDGAVCLCGLLGSEMAGLPGPVQSAVKTFLIKNIDWVKEVLPESLSPAERQQRAGTFVAAHQGAIMMSTSLDDVKIFSGMGETLIASVLSDPLTTVE